MTIARTGLALAGLLAAGSAAIAHHGWGEYDSTKTMTITSPIDTVSAGNPHVSLRLRHERKLWTAVLAPPSRMSTRGLAPESLKPGLSVTVEGYPSKKGDPEMRAERITVAGAKVELR